MSVVISYNSSEEMMSITSGEDEIFYGNYWDFSKEPKAIAAFLKKLGLDVKVNAKLPTVE